MPAQLPCWLYGEGKGVIVETQEDYDYYLAKGWARRAVDVGFGALTEAQRHAQQEVVLQPGRAPEPPAAVTLAPVQELAEEVRVVQEALAAWGERVQRLEAVSQAPAMDASMMEQALAMVQSLHSRVEQLEVLVTTPPSEVPPEESAEQDPPRHERRRH
jgi:hypothetical protein